DGLPFQHRLHLHEHVLSVASYIRGDTSRRASVTPTGRGLREASDACVLRSLPSRRSALGVARASTPAPRMTHAPALRAACAPRGQCGCPARRMALRGGQLSALCGLRRRPFTSGRRRHEELADAPTLHLDHLDVVAIELDDVADARDPSETR